MLESGKFVPKSGVGNDFILPPRFFVLKPLIQVGLRGRNGNIYTPVYRKYSAQSCGNPIKYRLTLGDFSKANLEKYFEYNRFITNWDNLDNKFIFETCNAVGAMLYPEHPSQLRQTVYGGGELTELEAEFF